ncbi:Hypothetical predicted protein [Mytilus galloprovincialis]|uniref:Uncharacterized protein n=1 Tax=Mytilus galloprovincialis TaxID=29158 RepID=A0A8B6GN92_MYTGA|nr:Hypothetical predicted protein [Mytilus galloprovincialis]
MDYKLVHSVQYDDCNVQRSTSNESESMWYKRPVWKWFFGGLAIGFPRNTNCGSSQSLQYQVNASYIKNEGITNGLQQMSTPATTTFYLPQSTTALKTIHTCQVAGGCNQPPKLQDGMECVFESKDGRTSVRYTLLAKQNVDTVDHCPVSYCQGQNYWSMFNASLSANECYTTGSYGAMGPTSLRYYKNDTNVHPYTTMRIYKLNVLEVDGEYCYYYYSYTYGYYYECDSTISGGSIAGAVVGTIIFIVIIVVIIAVCKHQNRTRVTTIHTTPHIGGTNVITQQQQQQAQPPMMYGQYPQPGGSMYNHPPANQPPQGNYPTPQENCPPKY